MNPAFAYLIATATAIAEIVVVTALWIVYLRAGPPLDAFVAGPLLATVPAALLFLLGAWLVQRGLFGRRVEWTAVRVLAACGIFAYLVTAIFCGPVACFQSGPNRAMGWFIVLGVAAAAVTHHLLLEWLLRKAGPG